MFSELQIRWSESKHDDLKIWIWSEQICTMQTRWPEDAEGGGIMMDWFDQLTDGLICCGLPVFPTPRGLRGNRYRNPSSPDGPNLVFPPEKGSSTHIRLLQTTHFAEGPLSLNEARLCFVGISSEMKSPPLQKKAGEGFSPPLLLKRKERRALEIQISSTHGYKLWRYRPATQIFWLRIDEKNNSFLFSVSLLDVIDHLFLIPLPTWDYWRPADHLVLFFVWRSMFSVPPSPLFFHGPNTFDAE